jgi:hypothetical protein
MTAQPLPQRVVRTMEKGWGCFFTRMHLILKEWLGKIMVSTSFGGVVGHGEQASGAAHARTAGS